MGVGCPYYPPPLIVRLNPYDAVPLRMSLTCVSYAYYAPARIQEDYLPEAHRVHEDACVDGGGVGGLRQRHLHKLRLGLRVRLKVKHLVTFGSHSVTFGSHSVTRAFAISRMFGGPRRQRRFKESPQADGFPLYDSLWKSDSLTCPCRALPSKLFYLFRFAQQCSPYHPQHSPYRPQYSP
eukprot:414336-Prorocentrum_minimum.AAC.1